MADLSKLNLASPETIDWTEYEVEAPRTFRALPPEGDYALRLPDEFSFARGDEGQLIVIADPLTIVGGEHDGYQLRFTRFSGKRYKDSKKNVIHNASALGDVLKAVGDTSNPTSWDEYARAFETNAGGVIPSVACVWEAYDKETKESIKGMKNFPKREDGSIIPYVERPTGEFNDDGSPKTRRVWANLKVRYRGIHLPEAR